MFQIIMSASVYFGFAYVLLLVSIPVAQAIDAICWDIPNIRWQRAEARRLAQIEAIAASIKAQYAAQAAVEPVAEVVETVEAVVEPVVAEAVVDRKSELQALKVVELQALIKVQGGKLSHKGKKFNKAELVEILLG